MHRARLNLKTATLFSQHSFCALALSRLSVPTSRRHRAIATKQVRRVRRASSIITEPADPVTLSFGRPDIGAYLTDTFTKQKAPPGDMDESGVDKSSTLMDVREPPKNASHDTTSPPVGRSECVLLSLSCGQSVSSEELFCV